jgi:hypothetical protein
MKKANSSKSSNGEMRAHYDIPWDKAVRGKYASRFHRDTYFVAIDPELKQVFPDADAINTALHRLAATKFYARQGAPHRKSA